MSKRGKKPPAGTTKAEPQQLQTFNAGATGDDRVSGG